MVEAGSVWLVPGLEELVLVPLQKAPAYNKFSSKALNPARAFWPLLHVCPFSEVPGAPTGSIMCPLQLASHRMSLDSCLLTT